MGFIKKWAIGLAASYAKSYITVDRITDVVTDSVTALMKKITEKTEPQKLEKICRAFKDTAAILSKLAGAIEDGQLSPAELNDIYASICEVSCTAPITDETLEEYIDALAAKLKERL